MCTPSIALLIPIVSARALGWMSYNHDRIAPSNIVFWPMTIDLSHSKESKYSLSCSCVPLAHSVTPSLTFTPTPIVWNCGERMYCSVVILLSENSLL